MHKKYLIPIIVIAIISLAGGGYLSYKAVLASKEAEALWLYPRLNLVHPNDVRGIYMTSAVASGKWLGARRKRDNLVDLIRETEINGLVIDVKESEGAEINDGLIKFVRSLQREAVWKIARVTTFTDNSQIAEHPDWYLKYSDGTIWRDRRGNAWLDPALPEVREYITNFCKTVISIGFDEIQFDYIRYPSDGNVSAIARSNPEKTKRETIAEVFEEFGRVMREYDPTIMLSVDVFGYVAQRPEPTIGQALEDAVPHMDYISPMVYASHYYSGFFVPADEARGLPVVNLSGNAANSNPAVVIHRSMLSAQDIINTVTTTQRRAKLRPWLQDFSMGGVWYGKNRVRGQIDAAHDAGTSGWILWNASNRFTESALNDD